MCAFSLQKLTTALLKSAEGGEWLEIISSLKECCHTLRGWGGGGCGGGRIKPGTSWSLEPSLYVHMSVKFVCHPLSLLLLMLIVHVNVRFFYGHTKCNCLNGVKRCQKMALIVCLGNDGPNQTAHLRSLIGPFITHLLNHTCVSTSSEGTDQAVQSK